MITYNKIGHYGRLGNQLFQFASTIGIARKLGYEVSFPSYNIYQAVTEHFKDGITRNITFDIPKAFDIPNNLLGHEFRSHIIFHNVKENSFHFDPTMFRIPNHTNIFGYFQSEKYFKHVEEEIQDILTFNKDVQYQSNDIFPKVNTQTVSIHLRRGDYVNLQQYHPICSPEYYMSAFSYFQDEDYNFLVFSDDIEYCKQLFGEAENLTYIYTNNDFVDLCLMSMCDHNIIANSSFSWWGAWLNKNRNKKVIAPRKWFGPAYDGINDTKDLYCENWIIV